MQTWPLVASLVTIAITAEQLSAQTPLLYDPPKFARISGTVLDGQDAQPLNHARLTRYPYRPAGKSATRNDPRSLVSSQ